jgi:NADP-dependent 3-hydroxy acid dehydrogenase YdfG
MRLAGKVAIISGAASGMGTAEVDPERATVGAAP